MLVVSCCIPSQISFQCDDCLLVCDVETDDNTAAVIGGAIAAFVVLVIIIFIIIVAIVCVKYRSSRMQKKGNCVWSKADLLQN